MPTNYDLRAEFPIAYNFIRQFDPLRELIHEIFFREQFRTPYNSKASVDTKVVHCIRGAASANNLIRGGIPVFFFQHMPFRNWMAEIIRASQLVRESPEFTYVTNYCNTVDFHFNWNRTENEDAEAIFVSPTAKGMYELKLLVDRFENHLHELQQYGMPQGRGH